MLRPAVSGTSTATKTMVATAKPAYTRKVPVEPRTCSSGRNVSDTRKLNTQLKPHDKETPGRQSSAHGEAGYRKARDTVGVANPRLPAVRELDGNSSGVMM